jgi:PPOX class probable F420-dependent enzyme
MPDIQQLDHKQYISLETFRKTGLAVRTPVWFVLDGTTIYVRTEADSGKVKRIRRSGKINIAPCKGNGAVTGSWQSAEARELADAEMVRKVNQMLDKKYGLIKKAFDLFSASRNGKPTVLEIKLA